jgi:hypothetical protein
MEKFRIRENKNKKKLTILSILLLNNTLQSMITLRPNLHSLSKRSGTHRQNHKFLHGELVAGVRAAVDHVECGHGEDVGCLVAGEVGEVDVEGYVFGCGACAGDGEGDAEEGVGSEFG